MQPRGGGIAVGGDEGGEGAGGGNGEGRWSVGKSVMALLVGARFGIAYSFWKVSLRSKET